MRQIDIEQKSGNIPIKDIKFDCNSRDDIPQILAGLQHIYCNPILQKVVFSHLEDLIPPNIDWNNGRPGMPLWNVFVLSTLRVNLNCDFDRLVELANEHSSLRLMLGHSGTFPINVRYYRQTVHDNLRLMTPEILDEINQAVVKAGHEELGISDTQLKGRCDSFVVETNVEYPTDIKLLLDAMRKIIKDCHKACKKFKITGWRQCLYNYQCLKRLYLIILRMRPSTSKDAEKKAAQQEKIIKAYKNFIERSIYFLERAENTISELKEKSTDEILADKIEYYGLFACLQIDLIRRRIIEGEKIPHGEKIFSLFEPHTEWISKGKAGVPFELGLRVCILEDHSGFILHHQVMEKETDEKVAISMVEEAVKRFINLSVCSFDKGFWKPDNREELTKILDQVILPKKGKWTKKDREIESSAEFIKYRKQHPAVESAINALEIHGLDKCPDRGIAGFKRYVALAIVGRNIQKLGTILLGKKAGIERRKKAKKKRAA